MLWFVVPSLTAEVKGAHTRDCDIVRRTGRFQMELDEGFLDVFALLLLLELNITTKYKALVITS